MERVRCVAASVMKFILFHRNAKLIILWFAIFISIYNFLLYWDSKSTSHVQILDQLDAGLAVPPEESLGKFTYGKRQWERKDHLQDYCQKHSYNKTPRKEELQNITVDDDNKIIYCDIQEVATKTWTTLLTRLHGIGNASQGLNVLRPLSGYTEKEKSVRLKTYFKFVIVLEPLQRLLSVYKDGFIRQPRYTHLRKQIVESLRPYDRAPKGKNDVSFSEFIQYFSKNITRNQHWQQYEKICHPCIVNYNFIGHLETIEEDAPLMLKMAGIDASVTFPPIHNSTGLSQVLEYYSQVPTRYITQIGELYRSDFEMFGYEYLGPVKQLLNQ